MTFRISDTVSLSLNPPQDRNASIKEFLPHSLNSSLKEVIKIHRRELEKCLEVRAHQL